MIKIAFISQDVDSVDLIQDTYEAHSREYAKTSDDRHQYEFSVYVAPTYKDVPEDALAADILIGRGLLAAQLKEAHPNLAVVEVPIGSELVTNIFQAIQRYGNLPIAVVGSFNLIFSAHDIDKVLGVDIKTYFQSSNEPDEIRRVIDRTRADGRPIVICGANTFREASRRPECRAVLVGMSRESIWRSISDAKHGAVMRRQERERAEQFRTVLNHTGEGVIATDIAGRIEVFNAMAGEILQIPDAVGRQLGDIVPRGPLALVFRGQGDCMDKIVPHRGEMLSVNKVSVLLHGDFSGHIITLQKSSSIQKAESKIRRELYAKGHVARYTFDDIIGNSPAVEAALGDARKYAAVTSNILIVGDTGTGKEMFAQGIHHVSSRRSAPFVAVNCAALSGTLLESELFGYVEGAFTGAARGGKPGIFEIAHTGTIFLDEISEIPMELQGRLLRVLQERQIRRLGDDKVIPIDVRLICATNKDLLPEVQQNKFRRDLFYRLNVLSLHLPNLKERGTDVLRLANHFIEELCHRFQKPTAVLTDDACALLMKHHWDGNIRELKNVCERLVVLNESGTLTREDFDRVFQNAEPPAPGPSETSYADAIRQFDRERIVKVLAEHAGDKASAAKKMGISRSTLWRRIKALGIEG